MRKCCCCISVHAGAIVLGILAIVISVLEVVVLIPYFMEAESFNPIQENLKQVYFIFEKVLLEHNVTSARADEIVENMKLWTDTGLIAETCFAGIYICISLFMIFGVKCQTRALMLPYLIIQMLIIIVFVVFTIGTSILGFFISILMGAIFLGVSLLASFLFIYFWMAVQKSYIELGNRDYMYSPAPVKPIYNPPDHKYHPSAPQQFSME